MKVLMTAFHTDADLYDNVNNMNDIIERISAMGITPQPVRGYWKGESEPSFMIHGVTQQNIQQFVGLAKLYQQDAILVVYDDGRSFLWDCSQADVQSYDCGDWQQVRRDIAIQFDGYTETRDGRYYVAATHADIMDKERRLLATQAAVIAANEYAARLAAV